VAIYDYQIATDWDNEADFDNLEALVPGAGSPIPNSSVYFVVKAYNTFRRGERRFSPASSSDYAGHKTLTWRLPDVDAAAYNWLYNTYDGQVTIRTTTGVDDSYSNWNAYALFPDPADLAESDFGRFENVDILMVLIETT
jgi:hypothetical protein